jgi:putative RNA 2'-phosphotransferase
MNFKKLDKIKVGNGENANQGIIIDFKEDRVIFAFSSNGFIGEANIKNITKIRSLKTPAKHLTKLLRHDPEKLKMDKYGYISVKDITKKLNITPSELRIISDQDDKGRFAFSKDGEKIRATQGHSIKGLEIEMQEVSNKDVELYHGTSESNWNKIQESGSIAPMSREYVHLSGDIETAEKVGLRHAKNKKDLVILSLTSEDLFKLNINIYVSENGVFQVKEVPAKILKRIR